MRLTPSWKPLAVDSRLGDTAYVATREDKVNILLQAYISQAFVEDFALVSDTLYVAQNGGRITRALLEVALSDKWAGVSVVLMGISKAIEKRIWPFQNPLCQLPLSRDLLHNLMQWADVFSPSELRNMSTKELGDLIHMNERHGSALQGAAKHFPSIALQYQVRPLNAELVRLEVEVRSLFDWDSRLHGFGEPFWLWVEDMDGAEILQLERVVFRQDTTHYTVHFHFSISQSSPQAKVKLRYISDKWLGAESEMDVPLLDIKMLAPSLLRSQLLDLPLLPLSSLKSGALRNNIGQRITLINASQTQAFWPVVNSVANTIFSAPAGCGKTSLGYISLM